MKTPACLNWLSALALGMVGLLPLEAAAQSGGDDILPPSALGAPARGSKTAPAEKPDQYVIQPGDTLWDISGKFWGDSFFWPKLWSYNPYIGNAHLIYPGNVLRFFPGNYVRPPAMDVRGDEPLASGGGDEVIQANTGTQGAAACAPVIPFRDVGTPFSIRTPGFIREEGFAPVGKIVKAPGTFVLQSERDLVYIQFARIGEVSCGDRFTIYKPTRKKVKHPGEKGQTLGTLYSILGEAQVIDVNDFVATARITDSLEEIERGDLVTPRIEMMHNVTPRVNTREVNGVIVEALNQENNTISTRDIIYIDRGQKDGITQGHSFYVVRQRDGLAAINDPTARDVTLPYQVIGKLVVVKPGQYVSEAVITESSDLIEVGDVITSQLN
jgi:hypothetical protein